MSNTNSLKKIHFIGIGGIGMSALAQLLHEQGIQVFGSDLAASPVTSMLEEKGIEVSIGQKAERITDDLDAVVYTVAIPDENVELQTAREKGIETHTYPRMLGIVSEGMYTIAVSGTHGKTTSTAMTADVLVDAGLKPTGIVGSLVKRYKSNYIPGDSQYFLVEACEYKRSFLELSPNILAITNIEADHLDYYKDIDDIISAFNTIVRKVPKDGYIVCNPSAPYVQAALEGAEAEIVDYTAFGAVRLQVPGVHNVENARVAEAIASCLDISNDDAVRSLEAFSGTWRRFEKKGETPEGALVYDDYAHHPDEVRTTLSALKEQFPDKKKIVVFQPHLYSRTRDLLDAFATSFADADEVCIAPIYAARETDDLGMSATVLAEHIAQHHGSVQAFRSFDEIIAHLRSKLSADTVIMTMGAGDIYQVADTLV